MGVQSFTVTSAAVTYIVVLMSGQGEVTPHHGTIQADTNPPSNVVVSARTLGTLSAPVALVDFKEMAKQWREDTQFHSSIHKIVTHPAYLRIIGLGADALPLILSDLETNRGMWFWALTAITGENPIRPEHEGNVRQMARDWLDWGRERGLI